MLSGNLMKLATVVDKISKFTGITHLNSTSNSQIVPNSSIELGIAILFYKCTMPFLLRLALQIFQRFIHVLSSLEFYIPYFNKLLIASANADYLQHLR